MPEIRDKDGCVIQRSQNLAGIHRYVSNHIIKVLSVDEIAEGEGKLCILFDNGASYETNFASFVVLKMHVRQWRNVYGAPLLVNGKDCGKVSYKNEALQDDVEPVTAFDDMGFRMRGQEELREKQ